MFQIVWQITSDKNNPSMFFFMKSFSFAKLHPGGPQNFYRAESWWWGGAFCSYVVSSVWPTHLNSQWSKTHQQIHLQTWKKGVFDDLKQTELILFHSTASYCKSVFNLC